MAIVQGYCTLAEARARIGVYAATDTDNDAIIESCIEAASRQIDQVLGYRLWQDPAEVTREFYADGGCVDLYEQPGMSPKAGISTTTNLVVHTGSGDGTWPITLTLGTDYILWPPNAGDEPEVCFTELHATGGSFPCLSGRPGVQITARFGWSKVPMWAHEACLIQTQQLFKAKDAPFGVATFGDIGTGMRIREALNPLAGALVKPHARAAVG